MNATRNIRAAEVWQVLRREGISSVIAVSPHPDDIAFSAGAMVAAVAPHLPTEILTVFERSTWAPNLDGVHGSPGLTSRIRLDEDRTYCDWLRAARTGFALPDTSLRGYDSRTEYGLPLRHNDLSKRVGHLMERHLGPRRRALILAPAGIGGHIDHRLVRDAVLARARRDATVLLYDDLPYAASERAADRALLPIGAGARVCEQWLIRFSAGALAIKLRGASLYRSQFRPWDRFRIIAHAAGVSRGNGFAERYGRLKL